MSALDKSVEAQVLNLLLTLRRELGLTYIFISHDLNVVQYMSDRVLVMYLGKVVEIGSTDDIYERMQHPYTEALLSAMPSMDPDRRTETPPLVGDPPNPINPPPGCRFHTRCRFAEDVCRREEPKLNVAAPRREAGPHREQENGHLVACHMRVPGSGHGRAPAAP